ncbi:glycerophosphodiester phosphodiesterase family protein [Yeosuana marina]|uniref:glycerophosphodiester phosphodiesterase family protein n=1 Tax=Yeosuana marina TaxID=1565536 RepID=UPI0030ED371E|tara:strand:+ start:1166 stop:2110 length:945 start_codon:yes stop_codon:yes gene_type:complete
MKKYSVLLIGCLISVFISSCKQKNEVSNNTIVSEKKNKINELIHQLNNPIGSEVLVISHRSDWRNFPENSLEAMASSIRMGVDMVEMDVAKTKDNHLVIMHDRTLDRTTTGKGLVSDWTLDSLKTLRLRAGTGVPTKYKIPTLEEALTLCKGKILINLDKSYEFFDQAFEVAKKTGTTKQIVMKGYNKTVEQVISDFGTKLDTITFMPIINLDKQSNALQIIDDYQTKLKVKAFEIVFSKDTSKVLNRFSQIKNKGSRVWVNSLWSSLNAGYEDNEAIKNPDSIYGWYIKKGVNMIQTDRPELLLNYLKSRSLH